MTKTIHLGRERKHLVIETFERVDMCRDCTNKDKQELYVTQPDGTALCLKCCVHIHGRIWKNKNGN